MRKRAQDVFDDVDDALTKAGYKMQGEYRGRSSLPPSKGTAALVLSVGMHAYKYITQAGQKSIKDIYNLLARSGFTGLQLHENDGIINHSDFSLKAPFLATASAKEASVNTKIASALVKLAREIIIKEAATLDADLVRWLTAAPVQFDQYYNDLLKTQEGEAKAQKVASEITWMVQKAVLASTYVEERVNGNDHAGAAKKAVQTVARVRKSIGFSIPKSGLGSLSF